MNWRDHITVDPTVCHGQACIRGTRILAAAVLDNLAAGVNEDELLREYAGLTREGIQAVLTYAAALAKERVVDLSA